MRQKTLLIATVIFQFAVSHPAVPAETGESVPDRQKTNAQWKAELTPQQYKIMRQKGTERAFSGKLLHNKRDGFYHCAACDAALFDSKSKFDSGTGWPSFDTPANSQQVELRDDWSHGVKRTEVICKKCGGHLGHLFKDGPTATGERFCINSAALQFETSKKHAR